MLCKIQFYWKEFLERVQMFMQKKIVENLLGLQKKSKQAQVSV